MSSTFGNVLHLSIFGQSHSPAIGCSLDGIPAGIAVDQEKLQAFLDRRAPGRDETATKRREADAAHIIAGVVDGHTTGAPIAAGLDGRLPSIASFTCDDVDGELLVVLLDRAGVAAATGSACSTGSTEPSHVLTAMGIDATTARGALRLSLASNATAEDIALLSERIPTCVRKARLISSTR